jgi:hypothetical protein
LRCARSDTGKIRNDGLRGVRLHKRQRDLMCVPFVPFGRNGKLGLFCVFCRMFGRMNYSWAEC